MKIFRRGSKLAFVNDVFEARELLGGRPAWLASNPWLYAQADQQSLYRGLPHVVTGLRCRDCGHPAVEAPGGRCEVCLGLPPKVVRQ